MYDPIPESSGILTNTDTDTNTSAGNGPNSDDSRNPEFKPTT
jgi:hypothetical protein